MFNEKYVPYFKAVTGLNITIEKRTFVTAAAVAATIAYRQPLPMEKVVSPEAYFSTNYAVKTRMEIGEFHKVAVLNFEVACDLIKKFWILRYNTAFNPNNVLFQEGQFVQSFTGFNTIFSEQERQTLDELSTTFVSINNSVQQVFKNLVAQA